jgi:hypothetical protein
MKRYSTGVGLVTAAALVLALSACAPAVVTNTTPPTGHPSAPAKAHQAATPSVRVPVTCASLFTAAVSSTLVGVPVTAREDETTVPTSLPSIAARQAGELHCLWGGQDQQDGGFVAELELDIAPDAAAGFSTNVPAIESQSPPTAKNTAGDQSTYTCGVQGDFGCSADMLVGTYWVSVYLGDLGVTNMSQTAANTHMQQALTTIAAALKSATPLQAWNPPGALPGFCTESDALAKVQTAVGESDFAATGIDSAPADAQSWAQQTAVYAQCGWGGTNTSAKFTSVQLAFLKGGSWALPALSGAHDPMLYMLGAYAPLTVPGADSAMAACSTSVNECVVFLTLGKTLVYIDLDDPGTAQVTSVLGALVTDIKAS